MFKEERLSVYRTLLLLILVFVTTVTTAQTNPYYTGADLSYLNTLQNNGTQYFDPAGNPINPYKYFAQRGATLTRLRLFHTPENLTDACGQPITASNLADVLLAARRATEAGMAIKLAIHYSDYFADPGRQLRPAAWAGLSGQVLLDSITNYTTQVLAALHAQGTTPAIVAIGNETTNGFVDATERTDGFTWPEDAGKFNAGLAAIRAFNQSHGTDIRSALHVTEQSARFAARTLADNGVTDYDLLGLSYYPFFSPDTDLDDLATLITELRVDYGKDVMIFETGFSYTTGFADDYRNFIGGNGNVLPYAESPAGQRAFLLDLSATVRAAGGSGVIYWEPAWVTSELCDLWDQGSSYENATLFDLDGRALPGLDFFAVSPVSTVTRSPPGIEVFPNPVTGHELTLWGVDGPFTWQLYDSSGRWVAAGRGLGSVARLSLPVGLRGACWLRLEVAGDEAVLPLLID